VTEAEATEKYLLRRRHRFQMSEALAYGSGIQYSNGIVLDPQKPNAE
jgi:hypothetical protein